jgi:uncharacterized membrane protein (DUF2068 family)
VTKLADEAARLVAAEVKRPDFGLRVIIVWKIVKGCLLLAMGISAFALVHSDLHELGADLIDWLGIDAAGPRVEHFLAILTGMTPARIAGVGVGACLLAALMFVESWGLHRRRVWAEWLTVIVTASLLPLEIYHLVVHPSLGKVLTLVANVAILIYLLRHRWLFVPGRIGRWWKARHRDNQAR